MAAGDVDDDLEAALEPTVRLLVSHLRQENAALREQLAKNGELIQRLTEQVEALNRRLFGKRSEKMPPIRQELRQQGEPGELTVDGTPMPEEPKARAKEKRRKARQASEPERQKRRRARKDIPTVIEVREVQTDALPECVFRRIRSTVPGTSDHSFRRIRSEPERSDECQVMVRRWVGGRVGV